MTIAQLIKNNQVEEAYDLFINLCPLDQLFVYRLYKEAIDFECCKKDTYPFSEYVRSKDYNFCLLVTVKDANNLGGCGEFNHEKASEFPSYLVYKTQFEEAFNDSNS